MNCHPTTWRDNTTINPSNHPIDLHETPKRRCGDSSWDWSNLEDCKLLDHVSRHGESRWQLIGKRLGKPALQCSERYLKHLLPQMSGSSKTYTTLLQHSVLPQTVLTSEQNLTWTKENDSALIQLHLTHGSNWELIANRLTTQGNCSQKKITAWDVRQRYEQVVQKYWPLDDQENRPLSSLLFRNSLVSWSNNLKNNNNSNDSNSNITVSNPGDQPLNQTSRPAYIIPLSSLKSKSEVTATTKTGSWKIRLMQPTHDSGFSESGLSNISQSASSSQQSLRCSAVKAMANSSLNSLLSTSTPVDLIKDNPYSGSSSSSITSPDKKLDFSLSSFIKHESPLRHLESDIDDHTASSSSAYSFPNEYSSRLTISPSLDDDQTPTGGGAGGVSNDLLNVMTTSIDDHQHDFVIQTPTKALSEADQLSFHLASPPVVLGIEGRYAYNNNGRFDIEKTPDSQSYAEDRSLQRRRPLCTRLFDDTSTYTEYSNSNNRLKRSYPTSSYDKCNSNCLAVLTATATAWNLSRLPSASLLAMTAAAKMKTTTAMSLTVAQKSRLSCALANNNNKLKDNNRFNSDAYKSSLTYSSNGRDSMMQYYHDLSSYKSSQQQASCSNVITWDPLTPLEFPIRQQPQLMLRRVVQVGDDMSWRKVAFGDNDDSQSLYELAKSFNEKFTGSKLLFSKKSSSAVAVAAAGGASRNGRNDSSVQPKITASSSSSSAAATSSSSSSAVSHETKTPTQR